MMMKAYNSAAENDIIVIEGAEVLQRSISRMRYRKNMGMVKMAKGTGPSCGRY